MEQLVEFVIWLIPAIIVAFVMYGFYKELSTKDMETHEAFNIARTSDEGLSKKDR